MKLIKINGVAYDVYDTKLTRSFQVLDGENVGRLMNGKMEKWDFYLKRFLAQKD